MNNVLRSQNSLFIIISRFYYKLSSFKFDMPRYKLSACIGPYIAVAIMMSKYKYRAKTCYISWLK